MAELPNFARERLRQSSAGEVHPDANLLAAFAENALTAREREQVLEHLSRCGSCRAIAGMALPQPEARPVPVSTREDRRWARWTVLRWGTLAASAVIIAIAVLVLRPQERRQTPAFPPISETSIPASPKTEPAPESETKATADVATAKKTSKSPARRDTGTRAQPKADAGIVAPSAAALRGQLANDTRAPAGNLAVNANVANAQQQPRRTGGPYVSANQAQVAIQQQNQTVVLQPVAPPPPAPAKTDQLDAAARPNQAPRSMAETVDVTAAAAAKDQNAESTQGFMAAAPSAAGAPARAKVARLAKEMPALRWTISPSGRISRSADGRTWADLPVGEGVGFRTISANGADIWAGGAGGALFHSADGGERWTRVRPTAAGGALTSDITRIEFTDPQHGTLLTASGQKWTTTDGGKTWTVD